jgi:ribosomal protein S18 acetylase RimI-like enzyme
MPAIRSATTDDVDEVVGLWRSFGGPTRTLGQHEEARALLARDPEALIVACDDEAGVIGSLVVGWDGWRCHLYRLVVHPDHRRHGVAGQLLAEARARAQQLGAPRLDAMVHRDNAGAIAFWESQGFELQDDDARWSSPRARVRQTAPHDGHDRSSR